MTLTQANKTHEITYTVGDAMDVLLMKLDEAIDDMEYGRVQNIEDAWVDIDKVQEKTVRKYIVLMTVDKMVGVVTVLRILQDGMDWEQIINTWLKI